MVYHARLVGTWSALSVLFPSLMLWGGAWGGGLFMCVSASLKSPLRSGGDLEGDKTGSKT